MRSVAGLRERGYNALHTRAWHADGRADALPALAQEVLSWKPDLIVAHLTPAMLAVQRATQTIPIVMAGSGDPVATGLVKSLARPGGNVTGVASLSPGLAAKSLELMRELRPGLRRLGVLAHASDRFTPVMLDAVIQAGHTLGLELFVEQVLEPAQYAAVFEGWQRRRVEAVLVQPSLPGKAAAELALQHGWPSFSFARSFVEQGGLLCYANDAVETARLVADTTDRILRGASPAELPVQQNTRFRPAAEPAHGAGAGHYGSRHVAAARHRRDRMIIVRVRAPTWRVHLDLVVLDVAEQQLRRVSLSCGCGDSSAAGRLPSVRRQPSSRCARSSFSLCQ